MHQSAYVRFLKGHNRRNAQCPSGLAGHLNMIPTCNTQLGRISTRSQNLKPVTCTGATGIAAARAGTGGGTSGQPPPCGGRRRTSGKRPPGVTGAAARPRQAGRSRARSGTFPPRQPWSPSGRGPKASISRSAVGASPPGSSQLAEFQHAEVHRLRVNPMSEPCQPP